MGARQELNNFHTLGSLGMAGILGLITGSWTVFALTGAALISVAIYNGDIRYTSHSHRGRRR